MYIYKAKKNTEARTLRNQLRPKGLYRVIHGCIGILPQVWRIQMENMEKKVNNDMGTLGLYSI